MTNTVILLGFLLDLAVAAPMLRGRVRPTLIGRRRFLLWASGTVVAVLAIATLAADGARLPVPERVRQIGFVEWTVVAALVLVAVAVVVARSLGTRDPDPLEWEARAAHAPRGGRSRRELAVVLAILTVVSLTTTAVVSHTDSLLLKSYWTIGAGVLAACLLAFLVGRRFTHLPVSPGKVLCIVPVFNEPADSLARTVEALLAQTVPVDVIVIDDGSDTPVVPTIVHERLRWWRHPNTGKRGAQVAVLRQIPRDTYDFILTVDSDSAPFPDACEHLLRAMSNSRVQAATGMLYVRNYRESFVSMAADIDIGSSCVMMRASRSMLGSLETTSGALALYRSAILYDHLDAYAVECGTGDDRWLALRALRRGEVVAVAEAGVETDMPTTLRGTYRQRVRWARSWWWMLPYVFRNFGPRQMISPLFGMVQLIVAPVVVAGSIGALCGVTLPASDAGAQRVLVMYVGAYLAVRYGLCALYLSGRPHVSRRAKIVLLLAGTPLAILLNLVLLAPTRYIALFRLTDNRWRTRQSDPNRRAAAGSRAGAGTVTG